MNDPVAILTSMIKVLEKKKEEGGRDKIRFLFEEIDKGSEIMVKKMDENPIRKGLKKLFSIWKLAKSSSSSYQKIPSNTFCPQSLTSFFDVVSSRICVGNGIESFLVTGMKRKFELNSDDDDDVKRSKRDISLLELHNEKIEKDGIESVTSIRKPSLDDYVGESKKTTSLPNIQKYNNEEKKIMKEKGYLTFSRDEIEDLGFSKLTKKSLIDELKANFKSKF